MPPTGRLRIRFSLMSLLLFTGLVCVSISHFRTSWTLDKTQTALRTANNELGYLTIDDANKICAIALPTFGPMQWRWRLHLPPGKRYQLRWTFGSIPESGLPDAPGLNSFSLPDPAARSAATSEPFLFTLAVHKNEAGQWVVNQVLPNSSAAAAIDAPAWLDDTTRVGRMTERIAGRNQTDTGEAADPLVLLRYRKGKHVPPNQWTVDMQSTDGLIVWIEEIVAR